MAQTKTRYMSQIDLMFFPLSIKSYIQYDAKMWTDIWEFPKNDKKQNNVVFSCLKKKRENVFSRHFSRYAKHIGTIMDI